MNREAVEKMTDTQRRIATGKILGWEVVPFVETDNGRYRGFFPDLKNVTEVELLPDYLNSLDDMHEAEKMLDGSVPRAISNYSRFLEEITGQKPQIPGPTSFVWHATARQKNTAFLMTMLP